MARPMKEILRSHCEFDAASRHVNGTDRESNHHYGDAYEYLFPDRTAVKRVLEVGTADGSGMLAWREAFPNAHVVGMDIHVCAKAVEHSIEFHIGDQRVKADCDRVAMGRQFDFICEDAFHSIENTLLTLFWLWPYVAPGGLYVVEEFESVTSHLANIRALWPMAEIVNTMGPSGGSEPLVVFRKEK